nr:MAG: hypothetical protein [Bacteriophage sp.]
MKIAIYFSASEKDIIVVQGEVAAEGAKALCISGSKTVSKIETLEDVEAILPDVLSDFGGVGELLFLLQGGTLNNDLSDGPYELVGVYDA